MSAAATTGAAGGTGAATGAGNGTIAGGSGNDSGAVNAAAGYRSGGRRGGAAPAAAAPAPAAEPAQPGAEDAAEPGETGADPEADPLDAINDPDTLEDDIEGDGAGPEAPATPSLDWLKNFGLDGSAGKQPTQQHADAILNDVAAFQAEMRGDPQAPPAGTGQPGSASPSAAPANQSRPPSPSATPASGQNQPPAPAPQSQGNGSDALALLGDEDLETIGEYGPGFKKLGESLNAIAKRLNSQPAQQAPAVPPELATRIDQIQLRQQQDQAWAEAEPFISEIIEAHSQKGFPAVPRHKLRALAETAGQFQQWKAKQGVQVSDQQALDAVYMAEYGPKVQQQAAQARAEGERDVTNRLMKRERMQIQGNGTGAPRRPALDPDKAATQAAGSWRRQQRRAGV